MCLQHLCQVVSFSVEIEIRGHLCKLGSATEQSRHRGEPNPSQPAPQVHSHGCMGLLSLVGAPFFRFANVVEHLFWGETAFGCTPVRVCLRGCPVVSPQIENLKSQGFDSVRVLTFRGGILSSSGEFPRSLEESSLLSLRTLGTWTIYVYMCMCIYIYIYIYIYIHTCIHMCMCVCVYIYIYFYVLTYILVLCIYIYIYI